MINSFVDLFEIITEFWGNMIDAFNSIYDTDSILNSTLTFYDKTLTLGVLFHQVLTLITIILIILLTIKFFRFLMRSIRRAGRLK